MSRPFLKGSKFLVTKRDKHWEYGRPDIGDVLVLRRDDMSSYPYFFTGRCVCCIDIDSCEQIPEDLLGGDTIDCV